MSGSVVRQTFAVLTSAVVLGVVAGLVWWQVAEPSLWVVRDAGISLTEDAARGQFQVVAAFMVVGAIAALVWSTVAFALVRRSGWPLVVAVMAGSVLAAVIAWQVGAAVGPPAPETVAGLTLGDTVPDELIVDALAPFLVWPAAAMVGVLLASWGTGRNDASPVYDRDSVATTAPVTNISP